MNTALKNVSILGLTTMAFIACEKDFSSLGTEVIGGTNFVTTSQKYPVLTYNKKVDPVRSDALPVNYLGIFNDPIYGTTTAGFVSQMATPTTNPSFGNEVVLDSVVLTIPYFSTLSGGTNTNGDPKYKLDSVFGSTPMKLTGFRNNYFLRDFDPDSDFEEAQKYYSNGATSQTGAINMAELEGDMLFEIPNDEFPDGFTPSAEAIVILDEPNEAGEQEELRRDPPALKIVLDNDYWQQLIIDMEGESELSNAANFEDYFRGVYFKAEPLSGNLGTMMLLDFVASANITLYYTRDGTGEDTDGNPTREQTTFVLNFSGNRINFLDNNYYFPLEDGDDVNGDQNLFLKGSVGSTAIINLFNGDNMGESAEFTTFKEQFVETDSDGKFVKPKRLVNEANLIFYVNQSLVVGQEPDRLYLYDIDNNRPLIDYILDPSTNNTSPKDSKILHSGLLERVDGKPDGEGIRYKIKITEHINNILLRDSTNVKLGLAVTGNINLENTIGQFDIITDNLNVLNKIPISTIVTPRGTVLHGNNTADSNKKVQLEIFYTEPNN